MKKSQSSKKSGTSGNRSGSSSRSRGNSRSGSSNNNSNSRSTKSSQAVSGMENSMSDHSNSQLHELFMDMLKDIYWAEQHLVEGLQKMCDAASTDVLHSAFEDHKFITQKHVSRLEKVFSLLGEEPQAEKCDAMEALVKEAEKVIEKTKEGSMTRDAGLIISAQKVEHYEIASYGSLVQVALTLDNAQAASILEKTLWEEEDTDSLLTEIAETEINPRADEEPVEEVAMTL
jgi:ferritin-like metal-binding protein YciE